MIEFAKLIQNATDELEAVSTNQVTFSAGDQKKLQKAQVWAILALAMAQRGG